MIIAGSICILERMSSTARNAGVSTSCLYVTYDNPQTPNLYHSVVDIGCRAANGQATEQAVFDSIWAKFESDSTGNINIYRVVIEGGVVNPAKAGNELYYYGISATTTGWTPEDTPSSPANQYTVVRQIASFGTKKLLQYRDDTCDGWADFFLDIVKAQGNANVKLGQIWANNLPAFQISLVAVNAGLGKHHNQSPLERSWSGHSIVFYNDAYYDTSYGINYGGTTSCVTTFIGKLEAVFDGKLGRSGEWRSTIWTSDVTFVYYI